MPRVGVTNRHILRRQACHTACQVARGTEPGTEDAFAAFGFRKTVDGIAIDTVFEGHVTGLSARTSPSTPARFIGLVTKRERV
jgi:hypothetical protein